MDIDNPGSEFDGTPNDLTEMERRLAAWRPSSAALDRDRMLHEAGRAAALAEGGLRSWRLATAALAVISCGLLGLLAHQRSSLALERVLRAQERLQRMALETALAARTKVPEPAPAPPSAETPASDPLPPTSYFALTSRLARRGGDLSSLDVEFDPESHRPASGRSETRSYPVPLRLQDIQRALNF
jgi:hypothetical protein